MSHETYYTTYTATLVEDNGRTLVEFPDCPGCQTFAEPGQDIAFVALEALSGWLATTTAGGHALPAPGSVPIALDVLTLKVTAPVPNTPVSTPAL